MRPARRRTVVPRSARPHGPLRARPSTTAVGRGLHIHAGDASGLHLDDVQGAVVARRDALGSGQSGRHRARRLEDGAVVQNLEHGAAPVRDVQVAAVHGEAGRLREAARDHRPILRRVRIEAHHAARAVLAHDDVVAVGEGVDRLLESLDARDDPIAVRVPHGDRRGARQHQMLPVGVDRHRLPDVGNQRARSVDALAGRRVELAQGAPVGQEQTALAGVGDAPR